MKASFLDNLEYMALEQTSELVKGISKCSRFQFVNTARKTKIKDRSGSLKSGKSRGLQKI